MKCHDDARAIVQAAHYDEMVELRKTYGWSKARNMVVQNNRDEYRALVAQFRAGKVSLVKPPKAPRAEMDSFDALILHERGMTVPEMARYDGCTQRAALRALVPQVIRRRAQFAGWWEQSPAPMHAREIGDLIGAFALEVSRVMAETA